MRDSFIAEDERFSGLILLVDVDDRMRNRACASICCALLSCVCSGGLGIELWALDTFSKSDLLINFGACCIDEPYVTDVTLSSSGAAVSKPVPGDTGIFECRKDARLLGDGFSDLPTLI